MGQPSPQTRHNFADPGRPGDAPLRDLYRPCPGPIHGPERKLIMTDSINSVNVQALIGKRVDVLDKGYVELQAVMGDDLSIVNAARVSYLGESKGPEKDKKLLFYLMRNAHTSPVEMVEFKVTTQCP